VPHYVAGTPSPPAIRALLDRLHELTRITVDTHGLDDQTSEYNEQVESGLAERPDVAALVRQIEEASGPEELPSGDDLAREIEQFLRDES
jgi:predicted ATP-grasp superfamily ATP-dependent carboligase